MTFRTTGGHREHGRNCPVWQAQLTAAVKRGPAALRALAAEVGGERGKDALMFAEGIEGTAARQRRRERPATIAELKEKEHAAFLRGRTAPATTTTAPATTPAPARRDGIATIAELKQRERAAFAARAAQEREQRRQSRQEVIR
jgi:hypothetical protein